MKHRAYIGLGSSQGERRAILTRALDLIAALPDTALVAASSWYETEPEGGVAKEKFINGVCAVDTALPPKTLLAELHRIETRLGRVRTQKWGDRTCDLDLLLYDDLRSNDPECTLPHPQMYNREFVLTPLAEIAPELASQKNSQ